MFKKFLKQIQVTRELNTFKQYQQALNKFKDKPINTDTVLDFIKTKGLSNNTKKMYLMIYAQALAHENLLTKEIKLLIKGIRAEHEIQPCPTNREVKTIIYSTNNTMYRAIVGCMAYSGMRISEVLNILVFDIDLIDNKILLRKTKNHSQRYVAISYKLKPLLENWLCSCFRVKGLYLFTSPSSRAKDKPYNKTSIQKIVKELCVNAGYPEYHCHSFRHYFATTLYKKSNNNLMITARACGHKSINTTARYIGTSVEDILTVLNK